MGSQLSTTPVIADLCSVLHIADEKGEWPNEQPIAQLASSYVESIGQEMQNDFDLYQMNQKALQDDFEKLQLELRELQSKLGISEEIPEEASQEQVTNDALPSSPAALERDSFTPQQHRELLDRCLHSIRKLS